MTDIKLALDQCK